ncbi:MAG TPA: hypothetical protein VFE69_12465, partial [Ilumatobacteraceae bacterium]|nr:hypothetical protein [Ilumatobacteraceae bacterium]
MQPPPGPLVETIPSQHERLRADWNRDIEPRPDPWPEEVRRRDPDHGEGDALDHERRSNHVHGAMEVALPEAMADDGDGPVRTASAAIVGRDEGTTEDRPNTKHVEEARTHPQTIREVCLAAGREIKTRVLTRPGKDAFENGLVRLKLFP